MLPFLFAILVPTVEANAFLSREELPRLHLNVEGLLAELEGALGTQHRAETEARAVVLEETLRPTFQALPRSSEGLLQSTAVRYLLHRTFIDRHGWYVNGFDTEGESWNSSSPATVLGHADPGTQGAFEERLSERGLSLREVALLAATLESFVHAETLQRLHGAYRVLNLSHTEEHVQENDVLRVLDTYMLMYVMGLDHDIATEEELAIEWAQLLHTYPTWNSTRKWMHEVRKEVLSSIEESRTSFDATVRVVEAVAERYGRWQDTECVELKEAMLKWEMPGTGRVSLATFYQAALDGQWQFLERKEYLRQVGALDETDPARTSVMIANYINSPANCLAASKFYSVCCISECEALLGHLERQIAAPVATPRHIVKIVEALPSATVDAPRTLPALLVERLEQVAKHHGGVVPFHGRLFNQWLHHAFPRECPYPHLSGTSKPVVADRWTDETGLHFEADEDTMLWHIEEELRVTRGRSQTDCEIPWSAEEELFISKPHMQSAKKDARQGLSIGRSIAFVGIVCSMTVGLMQVISEARQGSEVKKVDV